jgi:methionyl-tRNA synthetase
LKYYITTPIYYVNDVPHIGHAYTSIASDVIARFQRLAGKEVLFTTGTDEHGQKVQKTAESKGLEPKEFTDRISQSFRDLHKVLDISNDDFTRTTEERHRLCVLALWQKLKGSGNIYLGKYSGWYATRDESFYSESELTEGGLAPTGAPVEWVEEDSYFFALSKYQDKLLEFYYRNPDFIKPQSRYNEVVSFVKSGLHDLSVSRTSIKWGIEVPGNDKHIIYVWLDALSTYLAGTGYPDMNSHLSKFWPADVHIVGKDILRFHAVYWPAFLMAADLPLPKAIMAHGWWTNEGQKISKSLGNVIDPIKLIEEFGVDGVRYFLMREVLFGSDGNYSREALISRVNAELANKIGNLLQRTISLIHQNNNGKVPDPNIEEIYTLPLLTNAMAYASKNLQLIDAFNINAVLDNIVVLSEEANIYIDQKAPWKLKNTNPGEMLEVLYALLEALRYIAIMLLPFIPASANKMLDGLGVEKDNRDFSYLNQNYHIKPGTILPTPVPIFPKIV